MRAFWRVFLLYLPFGVMAFLTVPFGQRPVLTVPESPPFDRLDISQLASYLNEAGVEVRAEPAQKNGTLSHAAFLTSTKKDWRELNFLVKGATRVREWQGIVYCAIETPNAAAELAHQWGDRGLLVGPFVFYGDAELLSRINVALNRPAPADAP